MIYDAREYSAPYEWGLPSNGVDVPGTEPQQSIMQKLFDLPGRMLDPIFEPIFGPRLGSVPTSGQSQETPTTSPSWAKRLGSVFGDFSSGVLGPIFPMILVTLVLMMVFLIIGKRAHVL